MHSNHHWSLQSRHRTSEGTVTYLRCPCGQYLIRTGAREIPIRTVRRDPLS